jgi:hypothetical protein
MELIVFPDHCHNGVMVKIIIQATQFRITQYFLFSTQSDIDRIIVQMI